MRQATVLQMEQEEKDITDVRPLASVHMAEVVIDRHGRIIKNRFGPLYTPTWRNLFRDLRSLTRRKRNR